MKRLLVLGMAFTVCSIGAVAQPSAAGASLGTVTMGASASPTPVSLTAFSGVSVSFGFDASYSGGFNPVPTQLVFHFDNDVAFDTTGLTQCSPSSILGQSTAQAIVTCGGAKVGSGNATYNAGTYPAVITAFNGMQSGGHDTLLLHDDIDNELLTEEIVGVIGPSSRGGDFGTQIDFAIPPTPGFALTHLATSLDNLEPYPGHHYVSARCSDLDRTLNFAADFTYNDASTRSALATQSCPATGERAAALKKCKKKHSKKARKKCRKKAKELPV
jgi:hypothetical protein